MTPLLRYTLSTMLFRVVLLLVETIMMLVAQTGTLYIPVCSVLPNILFVFFNLVSLNTSSETQGLLDGTMRYFRAKVYFKSWRAPENLFLPNQLHAELVEFRPADWAEKYFSAYRRVQHVVHSIVAICCVGMPMCEMHVQGSSWTE